MKRIIGIILSIALIATVFCGCGGNNAQVMLIDLEKQPAMDDKTIAFSNSDALQIDFILAEAGYIKLLAYDNTPYEEYVDYTNKSKLVFTDEKGKALCEYEDVSGGYVECPRFDKGTVTATITFDKRFKDMTEVCVSWGFAPDTDEAQVVEVGGSITAAKINKSKNALFKFKVNENGLYKINCGELCNFESDCTFKIEDSKGDVIADKISIHETEWYYRKLFLTKGEYIITTSGIEGVARCSVRRQEEQPSNIQTLIPEMVIVDTAPVTFGILKGDEVINASFTANGRANRLHIYADGASTFYDSVQAYDLVIFDAKGKKVLNEEYCETSLWDISDYKGEYTVILTPHGNGIYQIELTNYVEE